MHGKVSTKEDMKEEINCLKDHQKNEIIKLRCFGSQFIVLLIKFNPVIEQLFCSDASIN